MMKKGSILNWFRRKNSPVINNVTNSKDEKLKIVDTTPTPTINNSKKETNVDQKKDFIIKPNRFGTSNTSNNEEKDVNFINEKKKESSEIDIELQPSIKPNPVNDRIIIINDERDTLIKPIKPSPIKPVIQSNKEKNKDKEEEKTFDEKLILDDITIKTNTLDEIEKMIKKNYYEIQGIKYELEILEDKEKDEIITEEIEKLIDELEKLIRKFEKIKEAFYQNNFEEIYNHPNDDSYINHLIEEYKTSFKNNNLQEATILQINQIEEYIELINEVINVENKKDDLNKTLNDKKYELGIRDDEFEKAKDEYSDIEKINNYIESFITEQDIILKDIEYKVNTAENITKKAEYKSELAINYTRLLTSTLLLATTNVLPFNRRGGLLKTGLMAASIIGLASAVRIRTKESKVITNVSFTDYETELRSSMITIDDMTSMINNAMLDIKFLREDFIKEFSEYTNAIPEYTELITKLDTIEKDLTVKQEIAKEYDKKVKDTVNKNNIKIKRLEEEYPN